MATHYNPFGKGGWVYGERFQRSTNRGDYAHYLGPCPDCGTACFDYGGGWRCMAMYCSRSVSNAAPNVGSKPSWWNTNILVEKDGDSWCAHFDDFINLQESQAGFGNTPNEAVLSLTPIIQ